MGSRIMQSKGNKQKKQKTNKQKMIVLNLNISIVILNISDLKIPIKKQRWSEQIQKIKLKF